MSVYTIVAVRPFGMFDTIIAFDAVDDRGWTAIIYADHRPARDIREALSRGESPEVDPEPWAVRRTVGP